MARAITSRDRGRLVGEKHAVLRVRPFGYVDQRFRAIETAVDTILAMAAEHAFEVAFILATITAN